MLLMGAILVLSYILVAREIQVSEPDPTTELQAITEMRGSFANLGEFFANVAEAKGGVHAFSLLRQADLPSNIDIHLLGHIIGDELYKQEGLEGMQYCTPEFRNACSHTIVVGSLLEIGEGTFDSVHDACRKAPGGSGAYTMCFHGFGHGVLAYNEYEVPDAVEMCSRVGTNAYYDREYVECVGGMIMEMVSGIHDPVVWEEKSEIYLTDEDPLHLCSSELIPKEAKSICYIYITPQIFVAAGADLGRPDPATFSKAFSYCDTIPEGEKGNRDACYGGLGKEFIVLVQDRDIRDFASITDKQLSTVVDWCDLSEDEEGIFSCLTHAMNSLYWGGENPVDVPRRFCLGMDDERYKDKCFDELIQSVGFYSSPEGTYRADFCASIPEEYNKVCRASLL